MTAVAAAPDDDARERARYVWRLVRLARRFARLNDYDGEAGACAFECLRLADDAAEGRIPVPRFTQAGSVPGRIA